MNIPRESITTVATLLGIDTGVFIPGNIPPTPYKEYLGRGKDGGDYFLMGMESEGKEGAMILRMQPVAGGDDKLDMTIMTALQDNGFWTCEKFILRSTNFREALLAKVFDHEGKYGIKFQVHKVEKYNLEDQALPRWIEIPFESLKLGDIFRVIDDRGFITRYDKFIYRADGDPYPDTMVQEKEGIQGWEIEAYPHTIKSEVAT